MRLLCLLLMGSLMAQDSPENQYPKAIKPFELYNYDLPYFVRNLVGRMEIQFEINESGEVENPIVLDTFNVKLNEVVLDKVRQTKYTPALQNGVPVKVRYRLPIVFKWNKK